MKTWRVGTACLWMGLAAGCWAAPVFTEDWRGAVEVEGGLCLWGSRHARMEGPAFRRPVEEGHPAGVLTAVGVGRDAWLALADGRWVRLGTASPQTWQAGRETWAATGVPGGAWCVGPGGVSHLALGGPSSPEVLESLPLPEGTASPRIVELALDGDRPWLRLDGRLWRWGAGWRPVQVRMDGLRGWAVWHGQVLALDSLGRLQPLLGALGRRDLEPDGGVPEHWRSLRALQDGLWLEADDGAWWEWADGRPRLCRPAGREGARWLPVGRDLQLCQTEAGRGWWRRGPQGWRMERWQDREPELVDRLPRWTSSWRLTRAGRLERRVEGRWIAAGSHPGAWGLLPAGAGPLVGCPGSLAAYSDEGGPLGSLALAGARDACPLEDHALVVDGRSLLTVDCQEERPREVWRTALPGAARVVSSPLWAAVHDGREIHLFDRSDPLHPVSVDRRRAPEGLRGLLLVEDRLYLFRDEAVQVWSIRDGRWVETALELPCPGAHWACLRGGQRLLTLDPAGCLRQYRLWDNLPVEEELCQRLPVAGNLRWAVDSVRVTGPAGWLDLPLPAVDARLEARAHPAGSVSGREETRVWAEGGRLRMSWAGPPPARVNLYDLLGRRLAGTAIRPGAAWLDAAGLASGCYLLEEVDAGGSTRRTRTVVWRR